MNPNITKIIEQYIEGALNEKDTIAFEQRMNTNKKLRDEVELQRSIHEGAKRASQRADVKKTGKRYHLSKGLKWLGLSIVGVVIIVSSALHFSGNSDTKSETKKENIENIKVSATKETSDINCETAKEGIENVEPKEKLNNLPVQYFTIPSNGDVVLSKDGVLISVPKNAFLLNGKPYTGKTIVQYQEAIDGGAIVKAGLSTMSGDKLLETQGMFAVEGFTEDGEPLAFNPQVGVYLQVPVDDQTKDMKLFDGIKLADGTIDWQNPEELEKIPIPVDMSELDFYPMGYEAHLDNQKWKTNKKSRDSLYLSFEDFSGNYPQSIVSSPVIEKIKPIKKNKNVVNKKRPQKNTKSDAVTMDTTALEVIKKISPSKVLAFWKKKFNNTNLATREFERRMQAIHKTCNDAVLKKYTTGLKKSISTIDKEIVSMGYNEFNAFAMEKVGAVNPNNPHLAGLQSFYEKGIRELRKKNKRTQEKEKKRREKWDDEMAKERSKEQKRKISREAQALSEEFKFNLDNVYKQLGRTKGFTLKYGGGSIKNIDAYVKEATVARKTTEITDPFTGKKAKITYNKFSVEVPDANKYIKLYTYLFPHQINSYQRIDATNGKFDYPLNDDIIYDIGIIGITDKGYEYFQKQTFNGGELGTISMESLTEKDLETRIQQLNKKRIKKPMHIGDELNWLFKERKNYIEQKQRQRMYQFREDVACVIFPCYNGRPNKTVEQENVF
ncbi:MAG: hypothetical protein MK066_08630 [Crocinitomicaceae bacterium]|nr:hypothetical protein [Crocinitomicaceae bacterium]